MVSATVGIIISGGCMVLSYALIKMAYNRSKYGRVFHYGAYHQ